MRVDLYQQPDLMEDFAEIHYAKETPEINRILNFLTSGMKEIQGEWDGTQKYIRINDILYFESVDKKTFAYLKESVWKVEFSLKELEEQFAAQGFVRINKSVIVNLYKIDLIKKDFEMRILLQLENKETLIINRHYKKNFQACIDAMKETMSGGAYENHR